MSRLYDILDAIITNTIHSGYGTEVDITNYTSTNQYTATANGFVKAVAGYQQGSWAQAFADGILVAQMSSPATVNNAGSSMAIAPVFKGQKLHAAKSTAGTAGIYFVPYV